MYVYRLHYQNLMVTTKQKSKINMYTKEKKYSKYNNKEVINLQKKRKKRKEKKKTYKSKSKATSRMAIRKLIDSYVKCERIKCSFQKIYPG